MKVEWTAPALKRLAQIKSKYFSDEETAEYRIRLVQRIEEKILLTGTVFRSRYFKNTFLVHVDRFIVSFRPSKDGTAYTITALKHARQNKKA
ncbi:type II toxin-antitoxin system RelE/ParE family toxin [Paenibacillus durus]|uniref:Type II toxin-antitoxin system RelE/ParE family toxin n=1 Tax=Paenibacillus durus ATCC 35681 TaxID=1333534 RepID=A0A0F7CG88_PAEDU|nr:type II toxin-antitoxin system RelE/ParE family toxin [Paenibacillus durus]AKG33296.1 hypothetical protein VK70_00610 [Paenibacillus durus ATCC 35681]